jgi:flagellar assembly factor FliW
VEIKTKFNGNVSIDKDKIIRFEQGLPGFEVEKEFYILPLEGGADFFVLQSVETPLLAFVMIDPFLYFKDYAVKISDDVKELLEIQDTNEVVIFSLLTIKEELKSVTANLQGPIVINDRLKRGKQVILVDSDYQTKHELFLFKEQKEGSK